MRWDSQVILQFIEAADSHLPIEDLNQRQDTGVSELLVSDYYLLKTSADISQTDIFYSKSTQQYLPPDKNTKRKQMVKQACRACRC